MRSGLCHVHVRAQMEEASAGVAGAKGGSAKIPRHGYETQPTKRRSAPRWKPALARRAARRSAIGAQLSASATRAAGKCCAGSAWASR